MSDTERVPIEMASDGFTESVVKGVFAKGPVTSLILALGASLLTDLIASLTVAVLPVASLVVALLAIPSV